MSTPHPEHHVHFSTTTLVDGNESVARSTGADNAHTRSFTHDDHVVQVVFDPQMRTARRRKSSLMDMDGALNQPMLKGSSCFVHQLLAAEAEGIETSRSSSSNRRVDGEERIKGVDEHAAAAMTKSQLHDMVLGVKELSKYFSSVSIKMNIRSVFVITKTGVKSLVCYTRVLAKWLIERGFDAYVEDTFRDSVDFNERELLQDIAPGNDEHARQVRERLKYWTTEMCKSQSYKFDFLGGDGTVLYTSSLFQRVVPPVLSFALGSLGFMTKFDYSHHDEILSNVFDKGITVGLRLRFEGTIMRSRHPEDATRDLSKEILDCEDNNGSTHEILCSHLILNEIVVDRGPNPTMSSTDLYADDMFLTSIAADGVCIATPSGSTAYNLAAGGSLCHPELPGMLVTVICAHALTFRPLIVPDNTVLRVAVPYCARSTAWVSFDGRERTELRRGDYVSIVASRFPLPAVQLRKDNKDWFDSIKRIMNWGDRPQQKGLAE